MPKPTFFNLPDEKRDRFVAAALDEFARHPYDSASVSKVIARLGIAKGSVYQYFDGKRDLFQWLVHEAVRRRKAELAAEVPVDGTPFFERLERMYVVGLAYWRKEPLWSRLVVRVMEPSKDEALEGFRLELRAMSRAFMIEELRRGQRDGSLRADLDLEVTASLLLAVMQQGLLDAYLAAAGMDVNHLDDDPAKAAAIPHEAILEVVRATIDFLRRGLGVSTPG